MSHDQGFTQKRALAFPSTPKSPLEKLACLKHIKTTGGGVPDLSELNISSSELKTMYNYHFAFPVKSNHPSGLWLQQSPSLACMHKQKSQIFVCVVPTQANFVGNPPVWRDCTTPVCPHWIVWGSHSVSSAQQHAETSLQPRPHHQPFWNSWDNYYIDQSTDTQVTLLTLTIMTKSLFC